MTTKPEERDGPTVSKLELRALEVLSDHYNSEGNCLYFKTIASLSGIEPKKVRRVVRSLARKGLAEFTRGLFDDEGNVAGSGYCCTPAGKTLFEAIDAAPEPPK